MFITHIRQLLANDEGMSSVEYALGTLAAAALAGILYTVVTGDSVSGAIDNLFTEALRSRS